MNRKWTRWIITLVTAMIMACIPAAGVQVQAAGNVALSKSSLVLDVKQSAKITLKNASGTVTWSTTNKKAATVKGSGNSAVITAGKSKGSATIKAVSGGKTYSCKVNVYKFALSAKKLTLTAGKKVTLTLKNASKAAITWKTSNENIVSIIKVNKHKVRLQAGASAGTAKVVAKVGKKKYTCTVKVKLKSIAGHWSGNQYVKRSGGVLSGGAYPIGNSYYVFDENGYLTSAGWHAINGYWYYSDSNGKTKAGGWASVKDNTQDEYWTNYTYYHDKKYFDSQGRWDMRKANKVSWDEVYEVVTKRKENCKADELPQGVYVLKPKNGKKVGYYQWITKDSVKYNDNRPIYAVKKKVYVAFGAPYSIQLKDLEWSVAKDNDPMVSKVLNKKPLVIGWIGNKSILYP